MISLRGARQMTPCEALPRFEGPSHVLGVEVTGSVADASLFLAYSIISAYLVWVRFKHADVTMVRLCWLGTNRTVILGTNAGLTLLCAFYGIRRNSTGFSTCFSCLLLPVDSVICL